MVRSSTLESYTEWAKLRSPVRYNLASSSLEPLLLSELCPSLDALELNDTLRYGYGPLVESVAREYDVATDCVALTGGATMANYLSIVASVGPGDDVLIECPTYEPLLAAAYSSGASIRRISRPRHRRFQIDPDELDRALTANTRLVVLVNLHNPTGVAIDATSLLQIGLAAQRVGARVLVDEVYLDALFDQPHRPAFGLGSVFISTSSLAKVYGLSGLRCGWVLCERELAGRIRRFRDIVDNVSAPPLERLAVLAFRMLADLRVRARSLLSANRDVARDFFARRDDVDVDVPAFGVMVCPRLRRGTVEQLLQILVNRYDTSVVPGRFFEMPDHFRVGIGGATNILSEGLQRLGHALDQL